MVGFSYLKCTHSGVTGETVSTPANGNIHAAPFAMDKIFVFYPKTSLCSCVSSEISQNTLFWKAEWKSFCWKPEFLTGQDDNATFDSKL